MNFDDEDVIYWRKNYFLDWTDFRKSSEIPSKLSAYPGCCTSAIVIEPTNKFVNKSKTKFKIINIKTHAIFIKEKSWQQPHVERASSAKKQKLLKHEQGHFDLCEDRSRRLKKIVEEKIRGKKFSCKGKTVEELEKNATKAAERIIQKIRNKFNKNYILEQKKYDKLTNHGINDRMQEQYNKRFEKLRN